KHGDGHDADEQRVDSQLIEESPVKNAPIVEWDAIHRGADSGAEELSGQQAGYEEAVVPKSPPSVGLDFAMEVDRNGAQDECKEDQHERVVKPGEGGRI